MRSTDTNVERLIDFLCIPNIEHFFENIKLEGAQKGCVNSHLQTRFEKQFHFSEVRSAKTDVCKLECVEVHNIK